MDVNCENDQDVYKQEGLKYSKMFGDNYIYLYNSEMIIFEMINCEKQDPESE